jgi:hypothetical protein
MSERALKSRLFISTMLVVFVAATGFIYFLAKSNASAAVVVEHCQHTQEANVDPIVHPGSVSHLHEFYGANVVTADSTPASLFAAKATSCDIAGDFSGYWHPQVYMDGVPIPPSKEHIGPYWRDLGVANVSAPPFGMEFVASGWGTNVFWACTKGGTTYTTPQNCSGRGQSKLIVNFPTCWDGLGTAPASFAYGSNAGKTCPAGFATHLAQLNLHVDLPIVDASGHAWTCAFLPDGTVADITSFHADFMDAFDPAAMASIVNKLNS